MASQVKKPLLYFRRSLFQVNFYRLHLSYFILTILVSSIIFYGSGRDDDSNEINGQPLAYIDALFLCGSAMTATGKMVAQRSRKLCTDYLARLEYCQPWCNHCISTIYPCGPDSSGQYCICIVLYHCHTTAYVR